MKNLELELSQITIPAIENNLRKRGRPATASNTVKSDFDPTTIKTFRGSELTFGDAIFQPIKTGNEVDVILSTEGGLMPATNMILVGAPGSGKTTVALDMYYVVLLKPNHHLVIFYRMNLLFWLMILTK